MSETQAIHLQSQHKGLKVCVDGGEMDYTQTKGRTPRVKRPPALIAFQGGAAVVPTSSSDPAVASFVTLQAKSRAEAVEKIRAIRGYGVDFTIVDAVVDAGVRAPVAAK